MTELKDFVVFRSLRVTQVTVRPKRVSATYELVLKDGTMLSNVLFYTYNKALFNRKDPADLNLASLMVSQVAMNYGLFCESLVFDGHFEKTDKEFIENMTENTSREILTNKLLIDNPFLVPPYNSLKAGKQERYTQAEIVFNKVDLPSKKTISPRPHADRTKYAILSSGGKDSLLSYGLIKEFGEPHPVFINEAGRHWFTAVNAFRYFSETEPKTAKAWCNSDRIFNWMLKNMPFIRKNYASVPADIYPIRLWTVAVFLFGVIPIALKNGLGNIIIGDEYDTSEKGNLNGISHYKGLYDQSKYFDNALTRYYQSKGWGFHQYSLLRSMSELLIMKTLLKRYPHLQKQQISCHAAHEREKRMYPCGNCEKCRRVIGMITALGESPANCGYTVEQVDKALNSLANNTVKQIGSDASQLYYLLLKNEVIEPNAFTKKLAKEFPRVMQLRFDTERSNLEDIPMHVRKPLFNILQQYSNGVAALVEGKWNPVELNDSFLTSKIYKYDE